MDSSRSPCDRKGKAVNRNKDNASLCTLEYIGRIHCMRTYQRRFGKDVVQGLLFQEAPGPWI